MGISSIDGLARTIPRRYALAGPGSPRCARGYRVLLRDRDSCLAGQGAGRRRAALLRGPGSSAIDNRRRDLRHQGKAPTPALGRHRFYSDVKTKRNLGSGSGRMPRTRHRSQNATAAASVATTSIDVRAQPLLARAARAWRTSSVAMPRRRHSGWTTTRYKDPRQPSHAASAEPTICPDSVVATKTESGCSRTKRCNASAESVTVG